MKIKFKSDYYLPLKKALELYYMIVVRRSVFHEGSKYYPKVFSDEYLNKLATTHANKFDL